MITFTPYDPAGVEPDDQIRAHPHGPADALDDADDVGGVPAHRHEVERF